MGGLSLPSVSVHDDIVGWDGVAANCPGWTRTLECTGHILESCDGENLIKPDQDPAAPTQWLMSPFDVFPIEVTLSATETCDQGECPKVKVPLRVRIRSVVTVTPLEDSPVPPDPRPREPVRACPRCCTAFENGVYIGMRPVTDDGTERG